MQLSDLNYLDIIILLPVCYGLVKGMLRGLTRELASIIAVLAGIISAKLFAPDFAVQIMQVITAAEWVCETLAYVLIFVGVSLLCKVVGKVLQRFLKALSLGWFDKLIGGLFGALKWGLIISVVLNLLVLAEPFVKIIKEEAKESSHTYKFTLSLASASWDKAKTYLPEVELPDIHEASKN